MYTDRSLKIWLTIYPEMVKSGMPPENPRKSPWQSYLVVTDLTAIQLQILLLKNFLRVKNFKGDIFLNISGNGVA